ncbi:MAG TPA: Na/Pi cotransporter family protein [Peptococcaceae bacterium]|nr:Na/Pi cotransporter family protein [Peptococcaceae bacterium]
MHLSLLLTLIGFLLLLTGLAFLRDGLEKFAGQQWKKILYQLTATPGKGFVCGIVATGFLQSSTALTLMTVSLVDAKLLPFSNALGLILGSNIGTTVTPQLLAFPLNKISAWLILPGLLIYILNKNRLRYIMLALAGLGIMFFALTVLQSALAPLIEIPTVRNWLHNLDNNFIYSIIAGTLIAATLHSSSAATGLAMLLTEEQWLNLPAALAFIFGANIGTCFTALFVSFFASRAAQRVAIFHVILNIFGVLIFFPFLTPLAEIISFLGGSLSRQVANAHTIFNLVSSLLAFPLLPYANRFLQKIR